MCAKMCSPSSPYLAAPSSDPASIAQTCPTRCLLPPPVTEINPACSVACSRVVFDAPPPPARSAHDFCTCSRLSGIRPNLFRWYPCHVDGQNVAPALEYCPYLFPATSSSGSIVSDHCYEMSYQLLDCFSYPPELSPACPL